MSNIKFLRRPQLVNPVLIVAWPGMGKVALRSAIYLVEKLKCQPFAQLGGADYFYHTASSIKNGVLNVKQLPQNYFYYWKNPNIKAGSKSLSNDVIIFVSNTQPDLLKADDYVNDILQIAHLYKVKLIVSFAAMPAAIDHTQIPEVWLAATNKELLKQLQAYDLKMMSEAEISGMNGLFLGLAKKRGFSGFCLLGEIPIYTIQIENPKGALAILSRLKRILSLPVDLKDLEEQVQFVEAEINRLVDYLKEGMGLPGGPGPISDAEIEKIKKSLTQLTRLPQSIKDKIEKYFELARKDISKANELKQELDKWSVYREYEDRFLDLFKKPKDKDN